MAIRLQNKTELFTNEATKANWLDSKYNRTIGTIKWKTNSELGKIN